MIKTHNKLEVEGNYLNIISVTYVKPKAKLKVNERLKALPLRSGIRLLSQPCACFHNFYKIQY